MTDWSSSLPSRRFFHRVLWGGVGGRNKTPLGNSECQAVETLSAAWHTTTSYWKKNNHMPFLSHWDNFRLSFSFFAFFLKTNLLSPARKYEACRRGSEIWCSRLPQTRKRTITEKKIRIDKACYIRLFPSSLHFLAMQGYKKNSFGPEKKRSPVYRVTD